MVIRDLQVVAVAHVFGGGLRSKNLINLQLGDGVKPLVVGDIDQELEVVQEVGLENSVLNVCNKEDPPKGVPEPKVEGMGLGTECRGAGVVDSLKGVTCRRWGMSKAGNLSSHVHQKARATVMVSNKEQATQW